MQMKFREIGSVLRLIRLKALHRACGIARLDRDSIPGLIYRPVITVPKKYDNGNDKTNGPSRFPPSR
ncbi:unnamed protein product [Lasius platythorax]|uniref:Uncharacterized protein n=1 Tax=Lasius platythorax TaxID=488582 RepID=A0AAV2NKU6_9HYME